MVVAAAQREGMEVVPEGGSLYTMDITLIQDGNATLEHNMPVEHFYDDVVSLWSRRRPTTRRPWSSPMAASPAIPIGASIWTSGAIPCCRATRRRRCSPRRTRGGRWRPRRIIVDADSAREAKKLADRGVQVSIGAHGQQAGLGPHWEMWSFVRGGWSPIEALRAGTIAPATSLGYAARRRLARAAGKLADLVVLDADPTD
jgi:hypothetical protein